MKLLTFFMLIAITSVSAKSYSQPTVLTFNFDNVTVSQVFREIERNSDYILIYNEKTLDINRKATIIADNDSIETILNKVFTGTKIDYKISGRQIAIIVPDVEPVVIDSINHASDLQQVVVTGIVKDAITGEALIGVSVVVKGTTTGQLTDINGKFSIPVTAGQTTLIFSFIGYTSQEVAATPGTDLTVAMELAVTQISEVVVVGYSTQKKESVVGAIAQVNNATIVQSAAPNVTSAIAGKLSGVLTIQQSGQPGANQSEIVVRGLSSWQGSAPLVLVDGVERDFQDMDPNEINTISVLKDASATAVFGSRGANGVIIVTTKRGSLGKPVVTFSGSSGLEVSTRNPTFIDGYTTMSMLNVARMNSQQFSLLTSQNILNEYRHPSTPLNAIRYPNVDWFHLLTKYAPTDNGNISVTGGTDFVKYFCTLGYIYEGDFFKQASGTKAGYQDSRYWYHRFNFRTNLDFTLTKTTQFSVNLGYEVGIQNSPIESSYGDWKAFYGSSVCDYPANYPAWVLQQIPDTDYPNASGIRRAATPTDWTLNPWSTVNGASFTRSVNSKLFTDIILDQKLDFILRGLSVKGKVSLNTYYSNQSLTASYTFPTYRIIWANVGVDANGDGKVDNNPWQRDGQGREYYAPPLYAISAGGLNSGYYTDSYYEMSLNYHNTFGKHTINALALMNFGENDLGTDFPYYNEALVGRVTYDYLRKYLLEINIGYTGSERFAPNNRFGLFPSWAVGWVVSEENFFKNTVPWMNTLKIRYSDGLVGSDASGSRWLYKSDYFLDSSGYIQESAGANTSAQWEVARKKDLGIEIGIFKNLFSFSVDLFDEQRSKMLLTPQSTTFLIGNSFKDLNLGSMKKHGIEIEAEFNKTTASKINYWIKGNFGFNENRVIFKDDPVYAPEYTKAAGKPLGAQLLGVLRTGTGYYTTIDDIENNPSPLLREKLFVGDYKFLDYNADGTISKLDNYPTKGQTYAPVTYSLSGGISYKGFDFNLMFQGNYGKYIAMSTVSEIEFYYGDDRVHLSQLNYWRPDNQNATHSTLHYSGSDTGDAIYSWSSGAYQDLLWRDASYLRLKEVYAGYNLKPGFLKRVANISNLLVYANATNLLTFTKLIKEWDPEMKSVGGGWYPMLSRINIGVKFTF